MPSRIGHHLPVAPSGELSSLASTLAEVNRRVTSLAEQADAIGDEAVATELFGIERSLRGAHRRLERLIDPPPPRAQRR